MTAAICTNCGKFKYGALCPCPACGSKGLDIDINMLLSDHHLLESELERIGGAVGVIHATGLDEETRFNLLAYYLSRKWPKLLEYNIDAVELDLQRKLQSLYRSRLAHLPGQEKPDLEVSPVLRQTWTTATSGYQDQDDAWQKEVRGVLLDGMDLAKRIVTLKIQAGEGALLERLTHGIRSLFHGPDYRRLAAKARDLIGEAGEYRRSVSNFCSRVKNGWSDRTKEQAAYFRGLCQRLEEMAERLTALIEQKAGINVMIDMDIKRVIGVRSIDSRNGQSAPDRQSRDGCWGTGVLESLDLTPSCAMNVFELAGFVSPIAGAVVGAIVGRKSGSVGLAIGIPVGLVIGLGCYFGLVGLSVVVGKLAGFGRDERETTRKSVVGLLTIIAMWMAPLFSAIVTEFAVSLIVRHLAH